MMYVTAREAELCEISHANKDLITPPFWISIWVNKTYLELFCFFLLESGGNLFHGVQDVFYKLLRLSQHSHFFQFFLLPGQVSKGAYCSLLYLVLKPGLH